MGCQPSDDLEILAEQLGADHPALWLFSGDPEGHLHDQRDRIAEHVSPEGDEEPRLFSKRRGDDQNALPGAQKYIKEVDHADP